MYGRGIPTVISTTGSSTSSRSTDSDPDSMLPTRVFLLPTLASVTPKVAVVILYSTVLEAAALLVVTVTWTPNCCSAWTVMHVMFDI